MTEKLSHIRHSLAHLLAASVLEMFPDAQLGVGPVIENGFYYDFLLPRALTPNDLPKLQKRMKKKIAQNQGFTRSVHTPAEAKKLFANQPFKLELIADLVEHGTTVFDEIQGSGALASHPSTEITTYKTGNFVDLCRGGHVEKTKGIPAEAFALTHVAGAYWRGDEKNPMLQRIYGVAFETKKELKEYLAMQEEARKRDHRTLGQQLGLFVFSDTVGKGLPLLTAKGTTIRRELERFVVDEEIKRGYQHVVTPPLAKIDLYKQSGHYPYYKDTMYPIMKVDDDELILRPMTCPHHFMLYNSEPHSYRELPIRYAELSYQFRYEKSGELSGLMRVREFTLSDAHIFCTKAQTTKEIKEVLRLIDFMNKTLGLKKGKDYRYRLSLGDRKDTKKYYKDDKAWDHAEGVLRSVLKELKAPFYEAKGEAAFYGPKIDIQMKKVNGQEESAFTVQYDFVMPQRFNLTFKNAKGKDDRVVVIHRSSIGAFERTIAFLIEFYAGEFPLWLSPTQVAVIPVGKAHIAFSKKLAKEFVEAGIRTELMDANETVGYKIRHASKLKIPYMLVVGDKETKSAKLHVRVRGTEKLRLVAKKKFIGDVLSLIAEKSKKL